MCHKDVSNHKIALDGLVNTDDSDVSRLSTLFFFLHTWLKNDFMKKIDF